MNLPILPYQYKRDDPFIKTVCYGCGNDTMKKTFNYLPRAHWQNPKKFYCFVCGSVAFYAGTLNKDSFRLIGIAVLEEHHGKGIGLALLTHMRLFAKKKGASRITFKTEIDKPAFAWWNKNGANCMNIKGNEAEMEMIL